MSLSWEKISSATLASNRSCESRIREGSFGHRAERALLHFGEVFPEALGHELTAQFGVVARVDGYGAIKGAPCFLHDRFFGCARGQIHLTCANKPPVFFRIDACDLVVLVVDDERLRVKARGKVIHEQRDDRRIGVAACKPYIAFKMFEAKELLHAMAFVVRCAMNAHDRIDAGMRDVADGVACLADGLRSVRCCG